MMVWKIRAGMNNGQSGRDFLIKQPTVGEIDCKVEGRASRLADTMVVMTNEEVVAAR